MDALQSVAIRRATEQDLDDLVRLQQESGVDTAACPRAWDALNGGEHFIYLAEDQHPFGFVCAGSPLDELPLEATGEIIGWYLAADYTGYGMGKKLLVRGLSVLKRRQFESALIWLSHDAKRARVVLDQLGFEDARMARTTNLPDRSFDESAYLISLEDYF